MADQLEGRGIFQIQTCGLCSLCKPILSYLYRCFGHFRQLRLILRRKKPHVNLRVPQVKSEQMWHTRIIHILEGGRCRHDHYHRCHHHNHGGRQAGRQAQLTPTTQFCPKSLLPPSYLPPYHHPHCSTTCVPPSLLLLLSCSLLLFFFLLCLHLLQLKPAEARSGV